MEAHVEEEEGATVEATEKKLTDKEIVAYSITFLLAGYETTSNTLAYISYLLALNPAVQKQLQTEIDEYFSDNPVTKHITQSHYEIIVLCTALASYPGHFHALAAMEKNRKKAWDHCYITNQKWWTQLVRSVNSVCTNQVHHFLSVT